MFKTDQFTNVIVEFFDVNISLLRLVIVLAEPLDLDFLRSPVDVLMSLAQEKALLVVAHCKVFAPEKYVTSNLNSGDPKNRCVQILNG